MEMIGGSAASYLACTSCVPVCWFIFIGLEAEGLLKDFQGRRGITSVVRWNPCPVIFGVDLMRSFLAEYEPSKCRFFALSSRLSFLLQNPRTPEGFFKGSTEEPFKM